MRTIRKNSEPACLTQHRANRSDDYSPDYQNLGSDCKQTMRESLCTEQQSLCCYCMGRIRATDTGMKIEHWQSHLFKGV